MPLRATPVWPWMRSKNPTPVTVTSVRVATKEVPGWNRVKNTARMTAIADLNGLAVMQSGDGISAI